MTLVNKLNKNEIRAYFSVYPEDISPERLTELIGLEPSKTHLKGQPIKSEKPSTYSYKDNLWEVMSQLDFGMDIEAHIINILTQLKPHKKRIIQFTKGMYKELALTIFYSESRPVIHLNSEIMKELGEYEVEMDFDFYFKDRTESS